MRGVVFAVALALLPGFALAEVEVRDPWVAEGPPAATALAGYMQLRNPDAQPRALVGGSSPEFGRVELHQTVQQGDIVRMVALERIEIPAQGEVALQPGGNHVMLIAPVKPLKAGDTVSLTLEFDDGSRQTLTLPVRKRPVGHGHHHERAHDHGHGQSPHHQH